MGVEEGLLASTLMRILSHFAWTAGLGKVVVGDALPLDRGQETCNADPIWRSYRFNSWPRGRRVPGTPAWEVVPNLAIEVISPTNLANEVVGEDRGLLPVRRRARVGDLPYNSPSYTITTRRRPFASSPATRPWKAGTVLPGFQLPLAELFEEQASEPARGCAVTGSRTGRSLAVSSPNRR